MRLETDPYAVLRLTPGTPMEQVTLQYRRLAKVFHPDRNEGDVWCQEEFRRINAAYEILADPTRKRLYDAPRSAPPPPNPGRPTTNAVAPSSAQALSRQSARPARISRSTAIPTILLLVAVALFLIGFSIMQSMTTPQPVLTLPANEPSILPNPSDPSVPQSELRPAPGASTGTENSNPKGTDGTLSQPTALTPADTGGTAPTERFEMP